MVLKDRFTCHTEEAAKRYRAEGIWRDKTIVEALLEEVARDPDRILAVENEHRLSAAQLVEHAQRLAAWLSDQGVGRGDVVSFQLPNWAETLVIDIATSSVGAISNPIIPIYRDAEVEFILRDACSKVIFVPEVFRSINYADMMERLRSRLPDLRAVVTVRGSGSPSYDVIVADQTPEREREPIHADDPRLLMYTSGTTGRAKGVLHSYNTLDAEIRTVAGAWKLGRGDVVLMPSPVTHITGYLYGISFPIILGTTSVLMDRWDVGRAIELIDEHRVSFMCAATPFLKELADMAKAKGRRLPSLRTFPCGGAPVPPEIVRSAMEAFENCAVFRVYGSTEAPTVSPGIVEPGSEPAAETDGYVVGNEVRVVDENNRTLPTGREGEVLARGPEIMLGYLRPEDNQEAFDQEGFFHTGDLGYLREDGALVITGRRKDLIIRGGENLSAKEIEDILYEHPAVGEVAIVAMPHERLGEGVCAFVVPTEGYSPALPELTAFLEARGLARQKFPERLEVVEALPRTASGKIQKFLLRKQLTEGEG